MSKGIVPRMKKYERKLDVEYIARQLALAKDDMIARAAEAQAELIELESKTRPLAAEYGVPMIDYPKYINFMRQGWKVRNDFGGATVEKEVAILLPKRQVRGCGENTLVRIADDISGVAAPKIP
jgi:hypothetical protein